MIMSRIFESFYMTKKMGRGNGLELSVSYAIIYNMKSSIFSENINSGTWFTITRLTISYT